MSYTLLFMSRLFGFPRLFWMLKIGLSLNPDCFESGPDNRVVISGWPIVIRACMLCQVEYRSVVL